MTQGQGRGMGVFVGWIRSLQKLQTNSCLRDTFYYCTLSFLKEGDRKLCKFLLRRSLWNLLIGEVGFEFFSPWSCQRFQSSTSVSVLRSACDICKGHEHSWRSRLQSSLATCLPQGPCCLGLLAELKCSLKECLQLQRSQYSSEPQHFYLTQHITKSKVIRYLNISVPQHTLCLSLWPQYYHVIHGLLHPCRASLTSVKLCTGIINCLCGFDQRIGASDCNLLKAGTLSFSITGRIKHIISAYQITVNHPELLIAVTIHKHCHIY